MINYGTKNDRDGMFYNIFPSIFQVQMCGYEPDEIWILSFEEDDEGEYWSFQDTDEDDFHLIFPHKVLFDVCFAYGVDAEVEAGRGRIVHLKITKSTSLEVK